MKLKVDEYLESTKDVLLLRSVVFILIDVVKWFAFTLLHSQDMSLNEATLWPKTEEKLKSFSFMQMHCIDRYNFATRKIIESYI